MKQLTDEVFAQVREALTLAKPVVQTQFNPKANTALCAVSEALAALDTAQPVLVNAMLVEALEAMERATQTNDPSVQAAASQQCRAALTAAKQAQPERAPSSDYQATFNAIADAAKQGGERIGNICVCFLEVIQRSHQARRPA